jgi:hypothetical protein
MLQRFLSRMFPVVDFHEGFDAKHRVNRRASSGKGRHPATGYLVGVPAGLASSVGMMNN